VEMKEEIEFYNLVKEKHSDFLPERLLVECIYKNVYSKKKDYNPEILKLIKDV